MAGDRSDDLRERLKALGYLNAPMDRFVLGGAIARRSLVALAASASVRIGVLAGVLLGPAGALALRARLPELVTSLADAGVVALYLAIIFGATAAAATFAVIVPAGFAARSAASADSAAISPAGARRYSAAAGLAIFLASLAYLTLWWRAAVTAAAPPTAAASALVLLVAVAISLVLGHAVMVTALAVAARVRSGDRAEVTPGVPLSSWRATAALAALAFAGAAALLFFSLGRGAADGETPASLTVVPTGERVVVIAVDGLDLALVDRLRARGNAMPHLTGLLDAFSPLATETDRDPARVWTTIATGQPPERHGIDALQGRQLAGVEGRLTRTSRIGDVVAAATDILRLTRPALASGNERRIPTFWEIAARAGLRTSVIHWWATWPAASAGDDAGIVLSDRALLRLEQGGTLDGEIAPAGLYETLKTTWTDRTARAAERAASADLPGMDAETRSLVTRSAVLDATIADLAADPALSGVDLQVVYLPGLDIAQHGLFDADRAVAASAVAARVAALEQYYVFLDGLIGGIAGASGQRTVVVVAEPGRVADPGPGVLALAGAPARHGATANAESPTSVAATVLYLLGVPVAADLSSPPALSLVNAAFSERFPVRTVPTYGARRTSPTRRSGKPLDQEMIERMRSLGYVR